MKCVCQIADGAEPGGVNRGHIPQTKDDDGRQFVEGVENIRELVGRTKEERAVNAVNNRVFRDILALQNVHAAVFHIIFGHWAHGRRSRNLANEHERGEEHPDFHGKS